MEDKRLLRLVKKSRRGDKDAFRDLVNLKARSIVYIAIHLMGNRVDGEDAAQEAIITLGKKIGTLRKAELFDSWLYRIVYNVCMDEKRKKARKVEGSTELDTLAMLVPEKSREVLPEEKMQDLATKEEIIEALAELPERHRLIVIMYYYEEMSYSEIAGALEVSEQVVANTLSRAKAKMRESFIAKYSESDLPLAYKGGAIFSGAAITQALTMDAQSLVSPSAIEGLVATAAAATIVPATIITAFFDSLVTKVITGTVCTALAGTIIAYPIFTQEDVQAQGGLSGPLTQVASSFVSEEADKIRIVAKVQGLPEGANLTTLQEAVNKEAVDAFWASIDQYQFETETVEEGYRCVLYKSNTNELDYVMVIAKAE